MCWTTDEYGIHKIEVQGYEITRYPSYPGCIYAEETGNGNGRIHVTINSEGQVEITQSKAGYEIEVVVPIQVIVTAWERINRCK